MLSLLARRALSASVALRPRLAVASAPFLTRTFITPSLPVLYAPTKAASARAATKKKAPAKKAATTKKTTARKTTAKKTTAKKKPAKKMTAASRKKAKKPKRKVVSKLKPKKKPVVPPKRILLKPEERPPKKGLSTLNIFMKKYYSDILRSNNGTLGNQKLVDITPEAIKAFKNLSASELATYEQQSAISKEAAAAARVAYWNSVSRSTVMKVNKSRGLLNKSRVRRPAGAVPGLKKTPLTPFFRFMAEYQKTPDMRAVAATAPSRNREQALIATELGKRWRALSDAQKAPYVQAHAAEKKARV